MKKLLIVLLFIFPYVSASAQIHPETNNPDGMADWTVRIVDSLRIGFHTNVLAWISTAPHLEVDLYRNAHWMFSIGGSYGWWGFTGNQHALQTWKVCAATRYYLAQTSFTGSSFGLRTEAGQIDERLHHYGRRGHLDIIGLTYAYTWKLSKKTTHWFMDVEIGAGYVHHDYIRYEPYKPTQCYHRNLNVNRNVFCITNVGLNISYRFLEKHKKH
jgi:hypothetical protein